MEEKNECILWIIRWLDPYGLECKTGTWEQVKEYAESKAKETNNTYVIN